MIKVKSIRTIDRYVLSDNNTLSKKSDSLDLLDFERVRQDVIGELMKVLWKMHKDLH